jgi:hypothetical protein
MTVVARMLLKCEERIVMGEWSTGSGGESVPRAAEARASFRSWGRTLTRLSVLMLRISHGAAHEMTDKAGRAGRSCQAGRSAASIRLVRGGQLRPGI